MIRIRAVRATALLALCASMSLLVTSAGASSVPTTERAKLPYGTTLIVRHDATVSSVALELWFRAPSIGFDEPTLGLARYAATAIAASKLPDGQTLSQKVKNLGGRFAITAYPDAIAIAASVPSGSDASILRAMTMAYFTPVLSAEGMRTGLRDVVVAGVQKNLDPETTLRDVVFAQLFTAGPAHYPSLPTGAPALSHVRLQDLQAFAARAFRSSNAFIAIAGNSQPGVAGAIAGGRVDGQPMLAPIDSTPAAHPATTVQSFAEDGVGMGWIGPAIADPKAATAMDFISDYLFRAETGIVTKASDIAQPDTYVAGQFVTMHDPGVLLVSIAGHAPDTVRDRALHAIEQMRTPLDAATFAAARAAFEYHVLSDAQTPLTAADNFGWYTIEGDPAYAPSDEGMKYVQLAESLDPAYVAKIAQQYLGTPTIVELKGTGKP